MVIALTAAGWFWLCYAVGIVLIVLYVME